MKRLISFHGLKHTARNAERAHGHVYGALVSKKGVMTPFGRIYKRPKKCQYCNGLQDENRHAKRPPMIAHHFHYGSYALNTFVVFVCHCCHGKIHNNKINVWHLIIKFGVDWYKSICALIEEVIEHKKKYEELLAQHQTGAGVGTP